MLEVERAELRVELDVGDARRRVIGDRELLGDPARGAGHQLHEADGAGRRHDVGDEARFLPRNAVKQLAVETLLARRRLELTAVRRQVAQGEIDARRYPLGG